MQIRSWGSAVLCALAFAWAASPVSAAITVSSSTVSGSGSAGTELTFSVVATSSTKAALSYQWTFVDNDNGLVTFNTTSATAKHKYLYPGTFPVSVTITEAGNTTPVVKTGVATISGSSSFKILAALDFTQSGNDSLKLVGVLRLPAGDAAKKATYQFNIGGILCGFTLNGRGQATLTTNANIVSGILSSNGNASNNGSFQIFLKTKPAKIPFADARIVLNIKKGAFQAAWADKYVYKRYADREAVTIPVSVAVSGINYPNDASQVFSGNSSNTFIAKPDKHGEIVKGTLR